MYIDVGTVWVKADRISDDCIEWLFDSPQWDKVVVCGHEAGHEGGRLLIESMCGNTCAIHLEYFLPFFTPIQ